NRDSEVEHRHYRHHHIQNADSGMLSQNDYCCQRHQKNGGENWRNLKRIFKGGGNGISHHLADAAPADQAGEGKQAGNDGTFSFAAFPDEKMMDVVGRAAPESAVEGILLLMQLGQGGLRKGSGGAQKGDDPHPENSSRASGGDGGHHAHQISHTHPGGGGNNQSLNAGDGVLIGNILFFHGDPQHFRKHAEGKEAGPDGEINAGGNQYDYQERKPQRAAPGQGDGDNISPQKIIESVNH